MTTGHLILRWVHISMGATALLSGAAAMTFLRGSRLHRLSGNVFFVSMLIMAASGVYISIFITPTMGNVMGGSMTFYLTATAWLTVWRKPGEIGRLEIALAFLGLAPPGHSSSARRSCSRPLCATADCFPFQHCSRLRCCCFGCFAFACCRGSGRPGPRKSLGSIHDTQDERQSWRWVLSSC